MKKREFNSIIRSLTNKKTHLLDLDKISLLDDETKSDLVRFIVRYRKAIVMELIPSNFDMSWLHSMGYMYKKSNKYFSFLCCAENLKDVVG